MKYFMLCYKKKKSSNIFKNILKTIYIITNFLNNMSLIYNKMINIFIKNKTSPNI